MLILRLSLPKQCCVCQLSDLHWLSKHKVCLCAHCWMKRKLIPQFVDSGFQIGLAKAHMWSLEDVLMIFFPGVCMWFQNVVWRSGKTHQCCVHSKWKFVKDKYFEPIWRSNIVSTTQWATLLLQYQFDWVDITKKLNMIRFFVISYWLMPYDFRVEKKLCTFKLPSRLNCFHQVFEICKWSFWGGELQQPWILMHLRLATS